MTPAAETRFTIDALNRAELAEATRLLGTVLERSPWLAQRVARTRPFADAADLGDRIEAAIVALSGDDKLTLLRAHPELAPPAPEQMTPASKSEQARLALAQPPAELATTLSLLNRRYRQRHGFPFIVALHSKADLAAVFAQFAIGLSQDTEAEIARAIGEVVSVVRARLAACIQPEAAALQWGKS